MTNPMTLAELNRRNAHPYHMYEAIQAQPTLISEVLRANTLQLNQAVEFLKRPGNWYFCGIGPSHAVHPVRASRWSNSFMDLWQGSVIKWRCGLLLPQDLAYSRCLEIVKVANTIGATTVHW